MTLVSIKNLESPIILTNKVIQKWVNRQALNRTKISHDDVKQVLLQYIKKYVITDHIDYKRVSRYIDFDFDMGQLFLTSIYPKPYELEHQYFREKHKVVAMFDFYTKCDYLKYLNYEEPEEVLQELNDGFISFESIKLITF